MTAEEIAPLPSCGLQGPMQPVGAFHFHVMDMSGQPYPSGYGPSGTVIPNDLNTAKMRPELGFFAQTPVEGDPTYSRTARFWYQAQQIGVDSQGQPIWSADNNTLKWENRQWVLFDPPPQ